MWQAGGSAWRLEQSDGELELWKYQRNPEPLLMGPRVEWPALGKKSTGDDFR
jgi:hypothetical protein